MPPPHTTQASNGWRALWIGLRRGCHPPLLLAWVVAQWVPAALVSIPAAIWLYLQTGHSPDAAALAGDTTFLANAASSLRGEAPFFAASAATALLIAALLSPWLNGMIVAKIRSSERQTLRGMIRAGLVEYACMFCMLILSILLMTIATVTGMAGVWGIEAVVLRFSPAGADLAMSHVGWFLPVLLALLVHVTVEAGRAWLGADPALHSVHVAWRRGLMLLLQQPGQVALVYLGTTVAGVGLAAGFLHLRTQVEPAGWLSWLATWACVQGAVAGLAWGRSARLHGLADIAAAQRIADEAAAQTRIRPAC